MRLFQHSLFRAHFLSLPSSSLSSISSSRSRKRVQKRQRKCVTYWDDDKVNKFISLVKAMPHIWDPRNGFYDDRWKKKSSFQEIGFLLNTSADECQIKWQNLRAQYKSKIARYNWRKTRESAAEKFSVNWKYLDALRFLDVVMKKPLNPNGNSVCCIYCYCLLCWGEIKAASPIIQWYLVIRKINNNFLIHLQHEDESSYSSMPSSDTESPSSCMPTHKRRKKTTNDEEDQKLVAITMTIDNKSESAQIFGEFVADRIRHYTDYIADGAKKKIKATLLEASMLEIAFETSEICFNLATSSFVPRRMQ